MPGLHAKAGEAHAEQRDERFTTIWPSTVVEGTYTKAPGGLLASVAASKVDSWAPATTLKSTVHTATDCQAAILGGRGSI